MIVFTSICMNYLPKALILGKSIKKYNKDIKFYVVLVERKIPNDWPKEANKVIDKVILAKDLGFKNFDKFIFKHSIVEASTSVKGRALTYLLKNESDKVVYIDPDIKTYKSLSELSKMLDNNDIILTPHLTIPESNEIDIQNNELCALQHGVYNLGFVAVKNSDEGIRFANWWMDRLELYCYDDIPRGIFTDQRWCDLAPAFFNVYILKNPGYNMAPWNLSTRKLKIKNKKIIVNDNYELVFFHYSGFDSGANETVFNYYVPNKKDDIYQLRNEYVKELEENYQNQLGKHDWSYNYYSNGALIGKNVRKQYRDRQYYKLIEKSPFSMSDEEFNNIFSNNNEKKGRINRIMGKIIRKLFK